MNGFIVPVYRHGETAVALIDELSSFDLPIILVDDGNDTRTEKLLSECAAKNTIVHLVRIEKNSGKGGAVIEGFKKAHSIGLSHALQIDADGQHDTGRIAFFLEESGKNPDKIICGYPEYDASAPGSRVSGRKISTFWAAIVTLSNELKDVLCGFRVYPVDASLRVTKALFMDKRMGFDPEIIVRLYWSKVYPVFHHVKVIYPIDGISNFRVIKDNIRISWMFSRLCVGMILRFPLLLVMRYRNGK